VTNLISAGDPHRTGAGKHSGGTDWARVLRPRAVALLGATGRTDSQMGRPLRWLTGRGYAGHVYPVNPKYQQLAGVPCYPSLADVLGPVDLVLALVPAAHAVDAVRQAGAVGAAAVVVFASGFAEVGPEGARLQEQLAEQARQSGVRVLGPNCQGIVYTPARLYATFTAAGERPLTGSCGIAYVGQSGAIGGSVLDLAARRGLDLTAWVSTGNQADVDLVEIGRHLIRDPEISVLTVYAETIADGAGYELLAAEAAERGTALVVLRSGRSSSGRRAAISHTGAMLSDDTAFRLVSQRHGVVLVDDVEELLTAARLLRTQPRPAGRRIAVVTTSGGAGILAADRCEDNGTVLPELAPETQEKLSRLVPAFGALTNPVDVTAQLFNREDRAFGEVCTIVSADPSIDALLVVITMVTDEPALNLARDLAEAVQDGTVPCLVVWLAGQDRTTEARTVLGDAGIPVLGSIAAAARVFAGLAPSTSSSPSPFSPELLPDLPAELPGVALPAERAGWALVDALGIRRPTQRLAGNAAEAVQVASTMGGPVVVKAVAPGLEHKADVGGVRLGVDVQQVGEVFDELAEAIPELTGVLIQSIVAGGMELLVGGSRGPDGWPPVLTVGLGGTATEIHRDLATALAPVDHDQARALLHTLRSWPLLDGHRGAAPLDVDAAVEVIVAVGRAMARWPELVELEINPLIVGPVGAGAVAVDVLVATRR
jgi:acyl-CoA synthetase (NDP forming)